MQIYQTYTINSGFWTPILCALIFGAILVCLSPKNANSETPLVVITMLGDSLTAGYGLPIGEGLTDQLQTALDKKTDKMKKIRVINAGVSGDTTAGGLARFEWSIPTQTDALIIALGGNDALRGIPPESTIKNIEAMIINANQAGLPVLLAGMGKDYLEKAEVALANVGLAHRLDHYPGQLSGGEQQRVALARAVIAQPPVLLADEPTGNLDQSNGSQIMDLIFGLKDSLNVTLIMVTHDMSLAQRCDRIISLRDGVIDAG